MSRNQYTSTVHQSERGQVLRQNRKLEAVERELRCKSSEFTAAPFTDGAKERRRTRLEQNWRHKLKRQGGAADIDQE